MRALALLVEYDGTHYAGWQFQQNARTIQETLEHALSRTFGQPLRVVGSGRTDAGVHARGQVVHLHMPHDAHYIPTEKVPLAVQPFLPHDIRIRACENVSPTFHARFDPVWREYVYRISTEVSVFNRHFAWLPQRPFMMDRFEESATWFVGTHDFTAFSKHNPDRSSYICSLTLCQVEHSTHHLTVRLRANRFMYGMCRTIVGAMMMAAHGSLTEETVRTALLAGERTLKITLAPSEGLYLNRVAYTPSLFDDQNYF